MTITNIALFMDYENIHISLERQYHIIPEPNKLAILVTEEIKKKGKILLGQAYADWEEYDGVQPALKKHGVDPRYVLSKATIKKDIEKGSIIVSRKNSSDIALALDASEVLHTRDNIDTFALISGDRDFVELVNKLHNRNKGVIIIGVEKTTSKELIDTADTFMSIESLYGITPSPMIDTEGLDSAGELSEETWESFIKKVDELQKSLPFLGLNYLIKELMCGKKDIVSKSLDKGILIKYKVENPHKPEFQTSACKLNEENPLVKKFLKKA